MSTSLVKECREFSKWRGSLSQGSGEDLENFHCLISSAAPLQIRSSCQLPTLRAGVLAYCPGRSVGLYIQTPFRKGGIDVAVGQPPDCIAPFPSRCRVVLHRWASMAGPQEIKLFGKWSYDDVEVFSPATRLGCYRAVERKRNRWSRV